ncbi:MAG: hypothetical protein J2P36_25135, partial [Ktedonobacteraceae bacterium]|nr:hypothetical protein [Ktedonobacteraceae bacterium]
MTLDFAGLHHSPTAYAATRDTSNGGIQRPWNQVLPTFAPPHHLDVLDLTNAPGDVSQMFVTLAGIVNRQEPRIYTIEGQPDEGAYTWLNDMNIPYTVHTNPWEVLGTYITEVKGVIIYDPALLDTINIATTLAGLKDGMVVSPDLAQKLATTSYNLPMLDDLRGKFSSALDAYTWEFQNLWPQTTHRMLIGLPPSRSIYIPPTNWDTFQTVLQEQRQITDSSNRAVYHRDLSRYLGGDAVYLRFQDSFPQDGWGPAVHRVTVKADGAVIAQFTPCTDSQEANYMFDHGNSSCDTSTSSPHRFADGKSYFVYRFVPPSGTKQLNVSIDMRNEFEVSASNISPPRSSDQKVPYGCLRDYAVANRAMVFWTTMTDPQFMALYEKILSSVQPGTPYLGWFDNEPIGVSTASQHGVRVLAADWCNNLTVFSGVYAPIHKQTKTAAPPLANKIYITFTVSDGDNIQYNEHYMRQTWDDPARGHAPLNWTINPVLEDAAPIILSHYQKTATPNDLLVAGPSGAGYFHPSQWPQDHLNTFLRQSDHYLRKAGLSTVYVLDTGSTLPDYVARAYRNQMNLDGLFLLNSSSQAQTVVMAQDFPVATMYWGSSRDRTVQQIQQSIAGWDGTSPLFI